MNSESSWWRRWQQPTVWGRPIEDLEIVFDDPGVAGVLHPHSPIKRLVIRPAWGDDHYRVEAVRRDNRLWLQPWEATLPPGSKESLPDVQSFRRRSEKQMTESTGMLMVIEADGEIAGIVSLGAVQHGAMSSAVLGYWIAQSWARQGITSLAVAAVIDLVIGELGLHRIEVNVRPENEPSLALCQRLGLRHEGLKARYMCIDGQWADHVAFAVDAEMLRAGGLVERRIEGRRSNSST